MDLAGTLANIAATLPALAPEALESILVSFDTLVGLWGDEGRPQSAALLRDAARGCTDAGARDRLLRAAEAVAAGTPCALTPEGLTGFQASAAIAPPPEVPAASTLPHLPVRHFFPGLVVRTESGETLVYRSGKRTGRDEFTLAFRERTMKVALDDAVLRNEGNRRFEPVPTLECLQELWTLVDERVEDADHEDLQDIRDDLDDCQIWLFEEDDRGPVPRCGSGDLAAGIFGADSEMAYWLPLLFAGVAQLGAG